MERLLPFERDTKEGMAIGVSLAVVAGAIIASKYHRQRTHGGAELHPVIDEAAKFVGLITSAMEEEEWTGTHRAHHYATDKPAPEGKEWEDLQLKYPGAPIEAFTDPHSPITKQPFGHLKVFFGTAVYHHRQKKKVMPYIKDLIEKGVPRDEWPPHLSDLYANPSWMDRHFNQRPLAGIIGMTAVSLAIAKLRGTKVAAVSTTTQIATILAFGGAINSPVGHEGQAKGFVEKSKVFFGITPAVPDENGSYASSVEGPLKGIFLGEENHAYHHENPAEYGITSRTNPFIDLCGAAITALSKTKIHGKPLAVIKSPERKTPKQQKLRLVGVAALINNTLKKQRSAD